MDYASIAAQIEQGTKTDDESFFPRKIEATVRYVRCTADNGFGKCTWGDGGGRWYVYVRFFPFSGQASTGTVRYFSWVGGVKCCTGLQRDETLLVFLETGVAWFSAFSSLGAASSCSFLPSPPPTPSASLLLPGHDGDFFGRTNGRTGKGLRGLWGRAKVPAMEYRPTFFFPRASGRTDGQAWKSRP